MWVERNGATWRVREEVGGRKVDLRVGLPDKETAKDTMAILRADRIEGRALVPRGDETLLDEWLDIWWPTYVEQLRPTAAHSEDGRVRNHVRPLLGDRTLGRLEADPQILQDWVSDLAAGRGSRRDPKGLKRKPLAPKTIRNCHGLLHVILDAAIANRLIRTNPCQHTKLPERVHREMRFLTEAEIARLIAATPQHWRPLVLLLVATGLRWAEAIALKAGRVTLAGAKSKLVVLETLQESSGSAELVWGPPKTASSRRTVSFSTTVAGPLAGLVEGKGREALVFVTPTGLPVRVRNFRRVWLKAVADAGLHGLRVHDLRHTHAAMLIAKGTPMLGISRRLGHSSIAVTMDLYGHLHEEVDEAMLLAIENALSGVDMSQFSAEVGEELAEEPIAA